MIIVLDDECNVGGKTKSTLITRQTAMTAKEVDDESIPVDLFEGAGYKYINGEFIKNESPVA